MKTENIYKRSYNDVERLYDQLFREFCTSLDLDLDKLTIKSKMITKLSQLPQVEQEDFKKNFKRLS